MAGLVGRKKEQETLERLYNSGRPEFVAVYGRRRVGKTFLIKQAFNGRFAFQHTGISPVEQDGERKRMQKQLESFYFSLLSHGLEAFPKPKTWIEAFFRLGQLLEQADDGGRQVIFIDELPWMDTPKSGFLSAFESFWNGWCSGRNNIMLVVCGSATSWILGNLLKNKGGLYGRITYSMKISPFRLCECEQYFQSQDISFSRYDIAQAYMVFGGIPYYLTYFQKGLSLEQNIDEMLFGRNALIKDELNRMFRAIFSNYDDCVKVVRLLATKHIGFTREEIAKKLNLPLGGGLTTVLSSLEESDFIVKYNPYGKPKNLHYYKLVDNFCAFWVRFVEANSSIVSFFTDNATSDVLRRWRGVAFEELCWQHTDEIKKALGVPGVMTQQSAWRKEGDDDSQGSQIDLLLLRADGVVDLCEMKFSIDKISLTENECIKLRNRVDTLKQTLPKRKTVHLVMVTTYGVAHGKHSGVIQKQVLLDDLFR